MSKKNPLVFLDVSIDGDPAERMVFELFSDLVPKTAENFRALCTGEKGLSTKTGKPLHYKGTFFHRIVKGSMAQAGDLLRRDGNFGESIYGEKFPDELLPKVKHDEPGLLSMATADRDTRGSLFNVTFRANHQLDRKHFVFGKLVEGHEVLKKIENAGGDDEGRPTVTVKIIKCGEQENENQSSDKRKVSKLRNGKDASSEANSHDIQRKRKHKKSSKDRRKKRRKYYSSDSDSSSDTETETSESDSESDSDISSSDISSSSDDKRKKRKRSSRRDKYKRGKKKDKRRDKRRRRRDKRSKRKSKKMATDISSGSEIKSESNLKDDDGSVHREDRKHKIPAQITAENHSPILEEAEANTVAGKKVDSPVMLDEKTEYPKENGQRQSNGIEAETRSEKIAEKQPDLVDDHRGKSRSQSISPRRSLSSKSMSSKSMSVSPKRSVSRSPSVSQSPPQISRGRRSLTRSPIRSVSRSVSRSPAKSDSRSPLRPKKGRIISPSSVRVGPRQSSSRSPSLSPRRRSPSRSPPRTSSRKSSKKSPSRSPLRSSRRSISRGSGRAPAKRSVSRSLSPIGGGRRVRSPHADRGRSITPSPDGSPKRTRRGRGFTERYSYARKYRSPPARSPIRYRYGGRSDRDRYASYRRSPRRNRSPPRERTPRHRDRGRRSRTRSPSPSRSPIRYRHRRYSRSRSPVETSRYRPSPRVEKRVSPSRSPSESRSSRSQSPKRASKEKSISSSESPPAKKGLVSYGEVSPDSGRR